MDAFFLVIGIFMLFLACLTFFFMLSSMMDANWSAAYLMALMCVITGFAGLGLIVKSSALEKPTEPEIPECMIIDGDQWCKEVR